MVFVRRLVPSIVSAVVVSSSLCLFEEGAVVVSASEPNLLRVVNTNDVDTIEQQPTSSDEDGEDRRFIGGQMEVEKGFKCRGKFDPKKKRAGKECEGGVKKTSSFGIGDTAVTTTDAANDLAKDVASEVHDLIHQKGGMIPEKDDTLFPTDETMMEFLDVLETDANYDIEEYDENWSIDEDGTKSKTVSFGGMAKLFWGCNITFSKEGRMKMKKTIACGAKGYQGMGKKT